MICWFSFYTNKKRLFGTSLWVGVWKSRRDLLEYICKVIGGVAEWLNAAVLKTVIRRKPDQRFESSLLRFVGS